MASGTTTQTRGPLYFGLVGADAVCDRHGEMVQQGPSVVERDGHVFAAREGVSLFACPECCLDLFADAGKSTADPDQVVAILWKRYLDGGWDDALRGLFVDLGSGRLEPRGGLSVVLSDDENFAGVDVPGYLRSRVARLV